MDAAFMVQAYWNGNSWAACSQEGGGFLMDANNFTELLGKLEHELPRILEPNGLWPTNSDKLLFMVNGIMPDKMTEKPVYIRGKGWARRTPDGPEETGDT